MHVRQRLMTPLTSQTSLKPSSTTELIATSCEIQNRKEYLHVIPPVEAAERTEAGARTTTKTRIAIAPAALAS
jgi:hypothetical protein